MNDELPYDVEAEAYGDLDDLDDLESERQHTSRVPFRERFHRQPDSEELLRRVADLVAGARPMPLSASAMVNKEELLELLEEAIERLPDELREARWLRKERDEYLTKVRSDGDEIL